MSDASMPHCDRCGRVQYDCICDNPDARVSAGPLTFDEWWANYRENIDPSYESGAKLIASNAWCGAVAAERCAEIVANKADEYRQLAAEARDDHMVGSARQYDSDAELLECVAAAIRKGKS